LYISFFSKNWLGKSLSSAVVFTPARFFVVFPLVLSKCEAYKITLQNIRSEKPKTTTIKKPKIKQLIKTFEPKTDEDEQKIDEDDNTPKGMVASFFVFFYDFSF
jgi:hypothetical protein